MATAASEVGMSPSQHLSSRYRHVESCESKYCYTLSSDLAWYALSLSVSPLSATQGGRDANLAQS